jgi:hypothetical protein
MGLPEPRNFRHIQRILATQAGEAAGDGRGCRGPPARHRADSGLNADVADREKNIMNVSG